MPTVKLGENSHLVLGMVLLGNGVVWDVSKMLDDYQRTYHLPINNLEEKEDVAVFTVDKEDIGLMYMQLAVPWGDIEGTAQYAYNWPKALDDLRVHSAHIVISVMKGSNDMIKRHRLFTQVISSILRSTKTTGVYIGGQSLLVRSKDYLKEASRMRSDNLPLNIWIYFGLRSGEKGNSGYTYGLTAFGKMELEILNSKKSLKEIRNFLFSIAHYVLESDVTFEAGQTCGFSAKERIAIDLSPGTFVKGNSFKLAY